MLSVRAATRQQPCTD